MNEKRTLSIEAASLGSLLIEIIHSGQVVAKATGFIVLKQNVPLLITNWHVVTGKDRFTGLILDSGVPDAIRVWFQGTGDRLRWCGLDYKLYNPDTGNPIWHEHKTKNVDVVAIPIKRVDEIEYIATSIEDEFPEVEIFPGETVSVIGFPFGEGIEKLVAIWKTGHIASDLSFNYNGLPVFLIDVNTKPSMSGSPVIFRRYNYSYQEIPSYRMVLASKITKFLGIYSGRTNEISEIGMVWKSEVIKEIIDEIHIK